MLAGAGQVLGAVVDADSTEAALEGLQADIELRGDLDRCLGQSADQKQLRGANLLGQLHLGRGLLVCASDLHRHGYLALLAADGHAVPLAVVQLGRQLKLLAPPAAHHQDQLSVLEDERHVVLGLLLAARGQEEHAVRIEGAEVEAQVEVALPEVALQQFQLRVAIDVVAKLEGIRLVGVAADLEESNVIGPGLSERVLELNSPRRLCVSF